ncbi:MAG: IS3 family transposase [Candidatus Latescibacteria bacterium]|nr:IS3 family transposase [Candidatus Latescibacterota bacterium]
MIGDLTGQRLDARLKRALLQAIDQAKMSGMRIDRACQILQLPRNRYYSWKQRLDRALPSGGSDSLEDRPSGPRCGKAPHRLLEEEKQQITALLKEEAYADLSPRQLSVVASEQGIVQASSSSFYRLVRKEDLARKRDVKTPIKHTKPEVNPTGPNQVWSWDLTYIPFGRTFLYFFAILDVYSRKIVGWTLSFEATVESAKRAWDQALCDEGLMDQEQEPIELFALSDHGTQMTAKSMAQFFKDLGISQLFARVQTPTDNAWIESFFRTFKYEWLRFQDLLSFHHLEEMIASFVEYYNHRRYHGAIGYVTPQQKHTGEDQRILHARQKRKEQARQRRLEIHRQYVFQPLAKAA